MREVVLDDDKKSTFRTIFTPDPNLKMPPEIRSTTNFRSSVKVYSTPSIELVSRVSWGLKCERKMSMPGAFPEAEEDSKPVQRTPKKRFVGRKTLEARQKENGVSLEETNAMVQSGESNDGEIERL